MFLKRLKLTNYRKFSSEKNIVEFISSKIVLNQDNDDINDNFEENSVQNDCDEIDVASDTTLIIGKNNAGKTTIITALDNLINHNNAFGANDFNYRYLQEYLDCYDVCNPPLGAPYIEFVLTIGLEEDSNDRISNLIPFMLVEDIEDSELDICIRYEVEDFVYFQLEMKELFSEGKDENAFSKFLNLLHNTDYVLKYYDKNISEKILSICGCNYKNLLKKTSTGETKKFTFRDFVPLIMVNEGRITQKYSPVHRTSPRGNTLAVSEWTAFQTIITGEDYIKTSKAESADVIKSRIKGQIQELELLCAELKTEIEEF